MDIISFKHFIFVFTLLLLSIYIIAIFFRAIFGPKVTDRIIAINMIGTKVIIMICIVAGLFNENGLIDVALVYAMINFVAMVVLAQSYGYVFRKEKDMKNKEVAK